MQIQRRGMSVFALGILFVLAMALMQGAQYFFLESVSDHSERLVIRQHAETLAQSAVAEALVQASLDANQPGTALHDQLRGDLATGGRSFEPTLAASALPRTSSLLSDPGMAGISFDGVQLHVEKHGPLSPFDPMNFEGVLTLRTEVETGGPISKGRVHEVTKGFKVIQIVPLSPLGVRPITVIRPMAVTMQPVNLNEEIAQWREARMTNLRETFDRYVAKLEEAAKAAGEQVQQAQQSLQQAPAGGGGAGAGDGGAAPPPGSPAELRQNIAQAQQAQGILTRVIGIYRTVTDPQRGYLAQTRQILDAFVPFKDARDCVLVARSAQAAVADLDLQDAFFPHYRGSFDAYQKFKAINDQVSATLQSESPSRDESLYRSHVEALHDYLELIVKATGVVQDFQTKFELLEPDPSMQMQLKYEAVNPKLLLKFSHLNLCSSALLVEDAKPDVTGQLYELIARLKRSGTGLHGNVFVRNPTQTLSLTGEFTGKATLFVAGALEVENLRKSPGSVLTIVVSGWKPVRLRGLVQANVVTWGQSLDLSDDPQIEGWLAMFERFPESTLGGRVTLDPAAPDPLGPGMRHVVLSPWTRSRTFDER